MDIEYEINRLSEKLQKYTVDKAIKNTNKYPLRAEIRSEMKQRLIFNQGDKKDDTTGNEIIKRIRAKREAKQRALQELEAERIGVQKLFANDSRRLASTIREFRDRYERWISRIRKSIKGVANEINKIKILEKYKNKFIEKYQQKQLHRQRM
jgi:hypothetical protein